MRRALMAPAARAVACRGCASGVPAGMAKMEKPDSDAKIAEFAKYYTQLTLKEVTALQRAVFKELGHSDEFYEQALLRGMGGGGGAPAAVAVAAPVAAAPAADEPAPEAPKKKAVEKTQFDVSLEAYPDTSKIKLIKDLRSVTSDSIKDAKDAIERKGIVARNLGKEDAEKLKGLFEANGATVTLQ